ncbi:DNA internalization-related competence protein ComEC/Rec2 [Bacillus sp. EB106-08-02-XG196]|uniref:DNA internalization-related competence protein ComEC/Rec2 n=1 Tax=Bacillus sp. EB106-08-02-XG196 TaxID=2737049 RepID=UPI0015C4C726|nr:DNA internalization-related competence protein ComEC/Rec2 [Bacillus sp. EB106-08-02-XG196]NWQ40095.1 DNA internalization-related competence protein ComEC/Rec2 [Bacillus sp. EB106-08-02-XG196]
MNSKCFYFAIAAVLGVLTSLFFLPILLCSIIYVYLLHTYKKYSKQQLFIVICLFITFFLTGQHTITHNKTKLHDSLTTFYLQYTENTKVDGDLLQVIAFDIKNKERLLIRYKIKTEAEKEALKDTNFYGRLCYVTGVLTEASIAKNPNAFNYQKYLAAKQIYKIVELENNPLNKCAEVKSTPLTIIKEVRFTGIKYLEKHFPAEIAALSAALIFGDRSMFDSEVLINYQKTGIVHLLAISGLHVSLLIGMVFYLGIRIGLTKQFMMNFLLVLLPIYAILTGASPSVIRAVLMLFIVLFVLRWKKPIKLSPIDAISLTLMIYVFFSPLIILDAGFQLSFSVSYAIILSVPGILPRYQETISSMVVISVIAQLAALPILLYHFFEISFISIAANLLYIPLFSFVFLPGLYILYLIQLIFDDTPSFLINLFMKIITLANGLIEKLADLSFAQLVTGRPNLLLFIIYMVIIVFIFLIWESGFHQKRKLQVIFLAFALITFQNIWNWVNPFGEVTMIDVGQGDSILIHYPFGKGTYLIDTGGTILFEEEEWKKSAKPFEVGRDVVVPFLKGKGITKLDKLILTHGDADHIGGALAVLKEIEVTQILMPSVAEPSKSELSIIHEAKKRGIQIVMVADGSQWKNEMGLFYVLSPEENYQGERNSGSIAIMANIGGLNWFFGGDLDQAGEERIIKNYPNLQIDVLKAGHHGSKTSTSEQFINKIKPAISWISVGEYNRYGHPHTEVLEHLENTTVYRTDVHGAITYRFYQESGTFSSVLHKIKQ